MGTIKRTFANNVLTDGKIDATDLSGTIPASNIANASVTAVTALPSALGDAIESVATDPVSPSEGQLWYNTTIGVLKVYRSLGGVWAAGGNMNTTRTAGGLAGTQTSAIAAGGFAPGPSSATELYNGTSWTSNPTGLGTARYELSALGTQTAALAIGGYAPGSPPIVATVESWNGSSWSPSPSMNTAKADAGTAGIQTAGLTFGGANSTGILSATESWNGTSWTTVNSMNTARSYLSGCGIQTSALAFGGYVPPTTTPTAATESWNGTSWTSVNSLNTARRALGGAGASNTEAVAFGGNTTVTTTATEDWNGTSWTTNTNGMGNSQQNMRGTGTQSAALSAMGRAGPPTFTLSNATEEYTDPTFAVQKVTLT